MLARVSPSFAVLLVAGCAGSTTVFGYPVNEEARIEERAVRDLACSSGNHRGATIRAHHESEDGHAYTVCCAKGSERCTGYFCTRPENAEREHCVRQ